MRRAPKGAAFGNCKPFEKGLTENFYADFPPTISQTCKLFMKLCVNSTLSLQISLVSSVLVRGLLFTGKNQNDRHAPDEIQGVCRKLKPHRQNEGFPNCTLKTEYREQEGQKNLSRTRTPAGETHFKISACFTHQCSCSAVPAGRFPTGHVLLVLHRSPRHAGWCRRQRQCIKATVWFWGYACGTHCSPPTR